jgi:uncharacterized protein YgbK (DUF1537 family)
MTESDLRGHLSKQTDLSCGLITILTLEKGRKKVLAGIRDLLGKMPPLILFDTLLDRHLRTACSAIWHYAQAEKTGFCVGSQELGYGLAAEWKRLDLIARDRSRGVNKGRGGGPILVVSGSCASVTARQIEWAAAHGFVDIGIHTEKLFEDADREKEMDRVGEAAISALGAGTSVVMHSALGPRDPRILTTKRKVENLHLENEMIIDALGEALGRLTRRIVSASAIRRVVLAGGDVSGRITRTLKIWAFQVCRSMGVPAPLSYVYSAFPEIHGLQIASKGGMVGEDNYFDRVRMRRMPDFDQVAMGVFEI